jgi:hypothetical protein
MTSVAVLEGYLARTIIAVLKGEYTAYNRRHQIYHLIISELEVGSEIHTTTGGIGAEEEANPPWLSSPPTSRT